MAGRSLKGIIQVCSAKRRFASQSDVNQAAGPGLKGYHCVACGGYHLTSSAVTAAGKPSATERKPTYETSLLGRAKLVRNQPTKPERRVLVGECLGKPKPDGTVKVRVEGKEYETTDPVQPAHARLHLRPGVKLRIEFCPNPLTVRVVSSQDFPRS